MNKLSVIKIEQRKIKHVYANKVSYKNYVVSAVLLLIILLGCISVKNLKTDYSVSDLMLKVYNPINQLFNYEGGIIFTNNSLQVINNKVLKFITPIKCSNITNINGELNYEIDSNIMVVAPEAGVIKEIGVLPNNQKYIEILHGKNIISRIENVYIVGVVAGQVVSKGKDIATVKLLETVKFMLFEDGVKLTNIALKNNEITWQN